ncbi:YdiK family protein [Falsibacillus pallidus]|uniref:YdiK family protein n=1 Tax=Falsibacillus pallidus TaxID=493781 RepID=UPI003D954C61
MRPSPLFSGFFYCVLGVFFTIFAIQNVNDHGWGFFAFILVFLATLDFGSGIRMIMLHFRIKRKLNESKKK